MKFQNENKLAAIISTSMRKFYSYLASCIIFLACSCQPKAQTSQKITNPVQYVNTLMGTDSRPALSNGNTYPAIAVPWGMNFWTPQTGNMGNGWAYTYSAEKIRGFKQTHQPSPWMNDYGQFSIMPVSGKLRFREADRASWFSHKGEIATPYYYSVYLADHDVTASITPTERAACLRFDYHSADSAYIIIDAFDRGSSVKIIPGQNKVVGYSTRNSGGVGPNFRNYFVIVASEPFQFSAAWKDSSLTGQQDAEGNQTGAVLGFYGKKGRRIQLKVASSFISAEQAELNLSRETGGSSFEDIRENARKSWNRELGRIVVEGGSDAQVRTFYSCLYRTLLFPQKHYEIDRGGRMVHYSPYNDKVMPGYLFAGTGFWDTFRALYPFLNLVYPSINREMQEGLINAYKEGGFLPEWSSPGYRDIMIGNNSASIVADAYVKGLRGYDIAKLYEALLHGANNEGPVSAVGRKGVEAYNRLGYVPVDIGINETAARTLEYAYNDFCIYQLGKALHRPQSELNIYALRCLNYKNLFDSSTKLMRGRNKDGSFQTPFNPFKWGDAFTEGNSWHYSWSVFHDIAGLKKLMGGNTMMVRMLDSVFSLPPLFDESYYRSVIHEIREMQIVNMGQYAHGNQPIQHMTYLYNYAGQPWKTQYWVREVMDRLYKPTSDGYCGDEDNGQTSAWYVFSALGFYPVCPATDQYVLGAPLFPKATIYLQNGKKLVIEAPDNSTSNRYVQALHWNGVPYSKNYVEHSAISNGGLLRFRMSASANRQRGSTADAYPYSFSEEIH